MGGLVFLGEEMRERSHLDYEWARINYYPKQEVVDMPIGGDFDDRKYSGAGMSDPDEIIINEMWSNLVNGKGNFESTLHAIERGKENEACKNFRVKVVRMLLNRCIDVGLGRDCHDLDSGCDYFRINLTVPTEKR